MGSEYNVGILILGSISSQRQYKSQDHFLILLEIGIDLITSGFEPRIHHFVKTSY